MRSALRPLCKDANLQLMRVILDALGARKAQSVAGTLMDKVRDVVTACGMNKKV